MPWIQLGRPQQLFVAQAANVILYQKRKRGKGQSTWQPSMTFSDHQGDICKFVISEGQLVTCARDKSIRTWNLKTGLCDGLYLGHSSDVHSVDCFGEVFVTGSRDRSVKVIIIIIIITIIIIIIILYNNNNNNNNNNKYV